MSTQQENGGGPGNSASDPAHNIMEQVSPAPRLQQLLHGIRLSAAEDLAPASDLDRLAQLIERNRKQDARRRA